MPLKTIYSFPGRVGIPGIGMTAWNQVMSLVEGGFDVHLCSGSCERPIPGLSSLTETMRIGGFRIPYRLIGQANALCWHDRAVARLPQLARDRVDIVHCWPSGAYRTLNLCRQLAIPCVLERPSAHTAQVFEVVATECAKLGINLSRKHYSAVNARRLAREESEFRLANYLLCPSEFVVKTFRARGFTNIMRHQYGYDAALFDPRQVRPGSTDRKFTAVFVGEASPLKGLHFALRAWFSSGLCETGRFIICGRFMPEYRAVLKDLLDHPSIEAIGFRHDVPEIMRSGDVLVLPSLSEGSALVTYEARACGLVLLVSDASGARCEHLEDALVHRAGDVGMLQSHLSMVAKDKALFARLRAQSLRGIGDLSWSHAGARLREVYREVVDAGRCPKQQREARSDGIAL